MQRRIPGAADIAFAQKTDTDTNYVRLSGILLSSPIYHGLATHDEAMIEAAKNYAHNQGIAPEHFEFQMLYGVRRDLQRRLVSEGYNVRVYIPVWPGVVSVLYAPAGGAAGECILPGEELVALGVRIGICFAFVDDDYEGWGARTLLCRPR